MCGIAGALRFSEPFPRPESLRAAVDTLKRRGPDDSGVWLEEGIGLAHRRLSVLDPTSAGHQPMISEDNRFVIVLNGEIYNFLELRKQVKDDNQEWKSQSDTEVVLAAYSKWGTACVERFHGMFSFVIWDRKDKVLFAARDRMGLKPFYYHHSSSGFIFASRPRALFHLSPELSSEMDYQALRFYFDIGFIPAPLSVNKEIRKLPPAHFIRVKEGSISVERYWDFKNIVPQVSWNSRSEEDLLDELDEIVSRSVRSRLVSDVPLGAFLSGGVDSSLVVSMMKKFSAQPVKTFTIGFSEPDYDESEFAREVADFLGTEHHYETLNVDDLLGLLPIFFEEFDEPFFDSSAFPVMAVSRMARRNVTVSLSGDGGDELFGGYHYYQILKGLAPLFGLPEGLRNIIAAGVSTFPSHSLKLLGGALREPEPIKAFGFSRSIAKDFKSIFVPGFLEETYGIKDLFSRSVKSFPPGLDSVDQGMRLDVMFTLPDDYLQKVDLASMAFSLEVRDPLLDQDLVEWAMKLPADWKLRGKQTKYLWKKLAYRYVPRKILDRPKKGFRVPIERWLRGPLKNWAEGRLNDENLFKDNPLDRNSVMDLWNLHISGRRNASPLLWAVLVFLEFQARET